MPNVTELASRAKEKSQQAFSTAQEQSRQLASSAQRYIQENPLRAVSYSSAAVLGLGIIIGRLLAPSGYDAASLGAAAREGMRDWSGAASKTAQEWLDPAKERSQELMNVARERSRELVDATQGYIAENPGRSAMYGAAVLLGIAGMMWLFSAFSNRES